MRYLQTNLTITSLKIVLIIYINQKYYLSLLQINNSVNPYEVEFMISAAARKLLKIPTSVKLPEEPAELYDRWFAGRKYETRFGDGWSFSRSEKSSSDLYDLCLEHRTAQFYFGLDSKYSVYVDCGEWIQIATSFVDLVEEDAILVESNATGKKRRGIGYYKSFDDFIAQNSDFLLAFKEIPITDKVYSRLFQGPKSIVIVSRFYTVEYKVYAIEFF